MACSGSTFVWVTYRVWPSLVLLPTLRCHAFRLGQQGRSGATIIQGNIPDAYVAALQ